MNFKDMLAKMSQLNEGVTEKTKTGIKHKGTYGSEYDTDADGNEKKKEKSTGKAGRPSKEDEPKYDTDTLGKAMRESKVSGSMKDLLQRMDSMNEAEGKVHKGTYGTEYDTDAEGNEKKKDKVAKGRGRPAKDDSETKFDTKGLSAAIGGKKPAKEVGKVSKTNSLKEYFNQLEKALNEAEQIQIKPASQMPKLPGQTSLGAKPAVPGQPQQMAGQPTQNTQVIAQGNKTLGTVNNPQLAQQIKQSIGKGEMTLMPGEEMAEGQDEGKPGKNFAKIAKSAAKEYGSKAAGERVAGAVRAKLMKQGKIKEAEIPSHDGDKGAGLGAGRSQGVLESQAEGRPYVCVHAKKGQCNVTANSSYEAAQKAAQKWKLKSTSGIDAHLADTEHTSVNEAKPDFLDMDKDGNKKESMKKAVADKKKMKVKEGMDNRLKAAHHTGRAHGLSGHAHSGKNYDDMEEARMYHEGYKQGLDECHGQMPIQGYVGENDTEVDDMASFGAHTPSLDEDEFEEGNAFTKKLATTPAGGSFRLGGKNFKDTSGYDASVFESWDNQLGALLLDEYKSIQEGLTVSISKGQQGSPDSVSVNAQDGEADQLLQFIKQAGLGIFGGEEQPQVSASSPMSQAIDGEPSEIGTGGTEIGVVDDHDGMMNLIRKVTGGQTQPSPAHGFGDDASEEEHDHDHEENESCNECGMMECGCNEGEEGQEQVDEVESEDQMEYEVAEDNAPDSGATDTELEDNDDQEANQAATEYDQSDEEDDEEDEEETVEEGYANGADDTFESDIDFMTKVISGGLNKQKSTGQTTAPIIASQQHRQVSESKMLNESVNDWKKLAGIK